MLETISTYIASNSSLVVTMSVNNVSFNTDMLSYSGNLLNNRINELHVNQLPASDFVV